MGTWASPHRNSLGLDRTPPPPARPGPARPPTSWASPLHRRGAGYRPGCGPGPALASAHRRPPAVGNTRPRPACSPAGSWPAGHCWWRDLSDKAEVTGEKGPTPRALTPAPLVGTPTRAVGPSAERLFASATRLPSGSQCWPHRRQRTIEPCLDETLWAGPGSAPKGQETGLARWHRSSSRHPL